MRTIGAILCAMSLWAAPAAADDPRQGTLVAIAVEEVFVPNGFDDNDEALAVVDGYLPDTCHKLAHNEVIFDPARGKHMLVQYARRFPGVCLDMRIPFFAEVPLGVLPLGKYAVAALGAAAQSLIVKEATSAGPDDHLYAPIDTVRIEKDTDYHAVIAGRFTDTCLRLDEVRVINSGRSIEVLPIMGVDQRDDCQAEERAFSWRVKLPSDMAPGRHLLHVRSLSGKSVNTVFSVASHGA